MKRLTCCFALAVLVFGSTAAAADEVFMGKPVFKMRAVISGGQAIELPMTDAGPIPAQADGLRVEFCGPLFSPSTSAPSRLMLTWSFAVSVPQDARFQVAEVSDVTAPVARVLVQKPSPDIKAIKTRNDQQVFIVHLDGERTTVSPADTPWLYEDGDRLSIFRVSLQDTNGKLTTLFQPCLVSMKAKLAFREMAARAGRAGSKE